MAAKIPSSKFQPLIDHVRDQCEERWQLCFNLSLDEMMVTCTGRSSEIVRPKKEPIAAGFKMREIVVSVYVFSFFPQSNRFPGRYTASCGGELVSYSAVVASLIDRLPPRPDDAK